MKAGGGGGAESAAEQQLVFLISTSTAVEIKEEVLTTDYCSLKANKAL